MEGSAILPGYGRWPPIGMFEPGGNLYGFLDLSRADTGRAYPQGLVLPVDHDLDFLQVGLPTAAGHFMGMADIMAIDGFLSAYITYFCHFTVLLFELKPILHFFAFKCNC
jgi:hypothetical protein